MAGKHELHPEPRDKLINFKVTQNEHKLIEKHCKKINVNVSVFLRYVVFNEIK